ncbi:MAG: class I SAM-dependent methyltransferase [Clostridiales Family XIII bacterium]|nr:class I SAM-dependent methyltransferase [Clostridiales Family XIII bacterium]
MDDTNITESTFDDMADEYDAQLKEALGVFGGGNLDKFAKYKIDLLTKILPDFRGSLLEFGCGTGRNIPFIHAAYPEAQIFGCDISELSIEVAKKTLSVGEFTKVSTPEELERTYPDGIDCIFVSVVMHHIPPAEHAEYLAALSKILKPEGLLIIFEHNPANPVTSHIFKTNDIDKGAAMLKASYLTKQLRESGFRDVSKSYILFFLWRNKFFDFIEKGLRWLPLGAQYYTTAKK